MDKHMISRREFIKATTLGLGGLALRPWFRRFVHGRSAATEDFPVAEKLGRIFNDQTPLYARPDSESPQVGVLNEDDIVVWLREGVGSRPMWYAQRFVETPDGFVYAPNLQPVANRLNTPLEFLPGIGGMWFEVTVPYVDLVLANPPARSPWLEHTSLPRLYYSQIMWVDQIRTDESGQTWYRVNERYGSFGDIFWAPSQTLRPIVEDDVAPISSQIEDKRVVVDVSYQTLSCYEGASEVYFCPVSTGPKLSGENSTKSEWATPLGRHTIWRKLYSVHMTGGTTGGGYDIPGIGWTVLFSGKGMAIHSTFWHNSYGVPKSHGCVNACPEDALWIFRWTLPHVPYEPGDLTVSGMDNMKVEVIES